MKKSLLFFFLTTSFAFADVYVNGYTKQNGTYVEPYYRTAPNNTPTDNYSYKGNTNPYNGKEGYTAPKPDYNNSRDGNKLTNPSQQDTE